MRCLVVVVGAVGWGMLATLFVRGVLFDGGLAPAAVALAVAMIGVPAIFRGPGRVEELGAPESDESDTFGLTPHEPVDACDHADASAETVEVDWDGDGTTEVIAWLCGRCGGKLSSREATRRLGRGLDDRGPAYDVNTGNSIPVDFLRAALADKVAAINRMTSRWSAEDGVCILDAQDAKDYATLVDEARRTKAKIDAHAERERAAAHRGVTCKGWVEVPGSAPGSLVRRYAVPGECLCGECEVVEVRAMSGEVVHRLVDSAPAALDTMRELAKNLDDTPILGGTINTPDVSIRPDGLHPR